MRKINYFLVGIVGCIFILGCTVASQSGKIMAEKRKPSVYMGVLDAPCAEVEADIRRILSQSPDLGLEGEIDLPKGKGFKLPLREEKDRKWEALVRVECNAPLSSTISALVDAQRRSPDGKWQVDTETADLEKAILKRLLPKLDRKTK